MRGFGGLGAGAEAATEQAALLKERNFSIGPLSLAGRLDAWRLLAVAWQPLAAFSASIWLLTWQVRYSNEALVLALYYVIVGSLLLVPFASFALMFASMVAAAASTKVRPSAVLFWTWWPLWRLVLCVFGAAAGTAAGNTLWSTRVFPHTRLGRLQAYDRVDPALATGKRLQDSGIVAFSASAGVDRTRTGCLKNGPTYCVAPVLLGGEVKRPTNGTSASAGPENTQDLFVAGVDCCGCPGEFRCGDWNVPGRPGGLRVVDQSQVGFYRLAAQEWAATHGRSLGHTLFYELRTDPVAAWRGLLDDALRMRAVAVGVASVATVAALVTANAALGLLGELGLARPTGPPPAVGYDASLLSRLVRGGGADQAVDRMTDPKYVLL